METLLIKATYNTPEVVFDAENNILEISGKSMPENILTFYNPVLEWLDTYCSNPNPVTVLVIKLNYFNSTTKKMILVILRKLEKINGNGRNVSVKWYYAKDQSNMLEEGEEYADLVRIPFEYVVIKHQHNLDMSPG